MRNQHILRIAATLVPAWLGSVVPVARYECPNDAKRIMGQYDPAVMMAGRPGAYRRPRTAYKRRTHVRSGGRKTRHANGQAFVRVA